MLRTAPTRRKIVGARGGVVRVLLTTADKPSAALEAVEVDPMGEGLLWPALDVAISAPGLLEDFFGYVTRAKIARAGGSRSTPEKVAAARQNGRKGGRKKRVPV